MHQLLIIGICSTATISNIRRNLSFNDIAFRNLISGQFGLDPLNNCSESQSYSMTCKLSLDFFDVQPQIRTCSDTYDIIDSCPDGVFDFCKLYKFLINYRGVTYSNPHCAQCHGVPLNATLCSIKGTGFITIEAPAFMNFSTSSTVSLSGGLD